MIAGDVRCRAPGAVPGASGGPPAQESLQIDRQTAVSEHLLLMLDDRKQVMYNVVHEALRPELPADCPPAYAQLMQSCWAVDACDRCAGLCPSCVIQGLGDPRCESPLMH